MAWNLTYKIEKNSSSDKIGNQKMKKRTCVHTKAQQQQGKHHKRKKIWQNSKKKKKNEKGYKLYHKAINY